MTRIHVDGDNGMQVYQRRMGIDAPDSLIMRLGPPYYWNRQIIYVDGEVEVHGVLAGCLTIVSAGDMWLIDNVRYEGADPTTARCSLPPAVVGSAGGTIGATATRSSTPIRR